MDSYVDESGKAGLSLIAFPTPLVNGGLTGFIHSSIHLGRISAIGFLIRKMEPHSIDIPAIHNIVLNSKMQWAKDMSQMRFKLLEETAKGPATLGLFEILTRKLATSNNGRPLSIYQEASCGLVSGLTASCLTYPITLARAQVPAGQELSNRNLFGILSPIVRNNGVLALWKGSGLDIAMGLTSNMGMLASYKRSRNYLRESQGFSKWTAQISAGIISGFFAAACMYPCTYIKNVKDHMVKQYRAGDKRAYTKLPIYVLQILYPGGRYRFYTRFLGVFKSAALYSVIQWSIYEEITAVNP